ncbi:MAG TPA: glycosyltransferase family 39 protein [Pyrinomonadaceae bacterium]|nr:glycosyltransferase family 39 protein [Pyrinomonadaceae bacterium]
MERPQLSRAEIFLLAASLLVVVLYFYDVHKNPVGFFVDEASIAYNAHTLAQHGADEHGQTFPLYFRAFGEYKSPVYIYVLAAVFRLTGPSILVARLLSAFAGLVAAALLGMLGARLSGRRLVGLIVFLAAALNPWVFEITRLVFEVALLPAILAAFLLLLQGAAKRKQWSWPIAVGLGALLGLMAYTYSVGRLLAPLFALGLAFFLTRRRWRSVVLVWIVFAVTLLPLAVFTLRNPGALSERFKFVTYVKPEDTRSQIALRFVQNYVRDFSPRSWLIAGDPEPRHHLPGMGSLLIGVVMLAAIGLIVVLVHHRKEAWWRFIIYGFLVAPIPASLTLDHFHTLRLITLPIFLLVLTAPAFEFLLNESSQRNNARRAALTVLLLITLLQGAIFQWRFHTAPPREDAFDSYYPGLLAKALAQPERPIYLFEKTPAAYVYAYWYATVWGAGLDNFQRLPPGEAPPPGAVVIGHELPCKNCDVIIERGQFQVYREKQTVNSKQ